MTKQHADEEERQSTIFWDLMERVGTQGKYQILCAVIWNFICLVAGGFVFLTPFIFFQDPYHCKDIQLQGHCLDYVCSLDPWERTQYIPEPTIRSLSNKFGDYRCPDERQILSLIQSWALAGNLTGIIIVALLGGVFSKKTFMFGSLFLDIVGIAVIVSSSSLWMAGMGLFFCLIGGINTLNVCYAFASQIVSSKYRQNLSMAIGATYSAGNLFCVVTFYIFPDYAHVLLFCFLPLIVLLLVAFACFVKDAPIELLTHCSTEKALDDFKFIAKINKVEDFDLTVQELEQIKSKYNQNYVQEGSETESQSFSFIDLCRYKSLRSLTGLMLIIDCSCAIIYFGPSFLISKFNFGIYTGGLVVAAAQFLTSFASIFYITYVPRRTFAIVAFAVCLVCCTTLTFIWDQNQEKATSLSQNVIVLVLLFILQFFLTVEFNAFAMYITQLYPTQVKLLSIGVIKSAGGMIVLVVPQIIHLCIVSGFNIMIIFAVLSAFSIVSSYLLPETLGKVSPDVIKQLQNKEAKEISNFRSNKV